MGQMVFTGIGAAVGGYFGGPMGAEAGGLIGGIIGTIFFPDHKSPNMPDMRVQNSAYGQNIPWLYGLMRTPGNVIWCGTPHVHSQKHRQGKGFMSPSYTSNNYQLSFATGLCEGPIVGVRRIWANGKLIYDISNPSDFEQLSGSQNMTTNFTVYNGDNSQMPDPTMESQLGVGNVPAHRGLAYVVFNELDLTPYGNIIPNLSFEVMQGTAPNYIQTGSTNFVPDTTVLSNSTSQLSSITSSGGLGWSQGLMYPSFSQYGVQPFTSTAYGSQSTGPIIGLGVAAPGFCRKFRDFNGTGYNLDVGGRVYTPQQVVSLNGTSTNPYVLAQLDKTQLQLSIFGNVDSLMIGPWLVTAWDQGNSINTYNFDTGQYNTMTLEPGTTHAWCLVGASTDHLYATGINSSSPYYGQLCKFDTNLNLIAQYAMPSYVVSGVLALGDVHADNDMYLLSQLAGVGAGIGLTHFDGVGTWTQLGIPADNTGNSNTMLIQSGVGYYSTRVTPTFYAIAPDWASLPQITVKSVVDDVCTRAGLVTGQWDATTCLDLIQGYLVANNNSGRDAIQPLLQMYFTDVSDTDGLLKFVRRGASPTVTIPWSALGATDAGAGLPNNPLKRSLQQEQDLPQRLTVTYYGASNDYNFSSQSAFRTQTTSNYKATMRAAVAISDAAALSCAQTLLWSTWANQETYAFETDMTYIYLEPTDVIGVTDANGKVRTVRLNKAQFDGKGIIHWTAQAEVPNLYPAYGKQLPVLPGLNLGYTPQRVGYAGSTVLVVLDISPLTNTDTDQGFYVAACGYSATWPGCVVDMSRDSSTFSEMTTLANAASIGTTGPALGNFTGGNQPDELNILTVTLLNNGTTLQSVSYQNFMNNENVAMVGSEMVGFRNATLVSGTTYRLNGLMRGLQGTEWAMTSHVAGEQFVALTNGNLGKVGINLTDLGQPLYFQPETLTQAAAASPKTTVVPANGRVQPLSPVMLRAFEVGTGASASVSLSWLRRARVNNQWTDGSDVPLDEATEGYTITATNGSGTQLWQYSFNQTFAPGTVPNATWPATTLTAGMSGLPFGSVATGTAVTITVQQHSDQGVLGRAASFTFTKV